MAFLDNLEEIFQTWRNSNDGVKTLVTLATATGTLFFAVYSIKIISSLYRGLQLYILNQYCCKANFLTKYGQWAVISGSTDGIGLSMAKELAQRGHSIVVIGRNEEKLARTKTSLEAIPNVGEVQTVKIDLSDSSVQNFENIKAQIDPDNKDIGILINNAGTFPGHFRRFNHNGLDELRNIVNLNVLAPLYLTRMIMPSMLERQKGLILNVSSIIGNVDVPYVSVYGPTKKFLNAFSKVLQIEYSAHPIDIVNLTPGGVHTKLFTESVTMEKPGLANPSPDYYANKTLNAVSTPMKTISGTMIHGISAKVSKLVNSLGLDPFMFRLNLKLNARDYQISPVMKRKAMQRRSEVDNDQ